MSVIYCIISMFHVTPAPIKNLHLWPVNHRSCRVCVCRQTSQRILSWLFITVAGRMGFIFVYMFVCTVGNDGAPRLFIHVCLGSSFFFFLEDKPTIQKCGVILEQSKTAPRSFEFSEEMERGLFLGTNVYKCMALKESQGVIKRYNYNPAVSPLD